MNDIKLIKAVLNNKIVSAMYLGTKLLWNAIRSCFGSGKWINDKSWSNIEGWKN